MKQSNIKEIIIGLENCEGILIPAEAIEHFIYAIGDCEFEDMKSLSMVNMLIHEHQGIRNLTDESSPIECLQRIHQYKDITRIIVKYNDNSHEDSYILYWREKDNYNSGQQTYLRDNKALHITIEELSDI